MFIYMQVARSIDRGLQVAVRVRIYIKKKVAVAITMYITVFPPTRCGFIKPSTLGSINACQWFKSISW